MRGVGVRSVGVVGALVLAAAGVSAAVGPASAEGCAEVEVSYARGTDLSGAAKPTDPDPVLDALAAALEKRAAGTSVAYYRVNYPASLAADSPARGNRDLVEHLASQAAACPNQEFVLVGYSQGANVVDNAIGVSSDGAVVGGPIVATIPAAVEPRVKAVVLYGNPIRGFPTFRTVTGPYAARTLDDCAKGDPVCGSGLDLTAHLSYDGPTHSAPAADFVATHLTPTQ